jgi:hypothetical protein
MGHKSHGTDGGCNQGRNEDFFHAGLQELVKVGFDWGFDLRVLPDDCRFWHFNLEVL